MPIRVLLVDEHGLLRDALLALLGSEDGIEVVGQAADGNEAIAEAKRLEPDVVLMEVILPGLDGIAATRAIARAAPRAKVLILSAQRSPDTVAQALQAGALGYLSKRSRGAELAKALQAVGAGERYLGSGISQSAVQGGGPLGLLTDTERTILKLTAEGKSNVEMAQVLSLSHRTVETYRLIMMRKLGIRGLPALVKLAIRQGLATLD